MGASGGEWGVGMSGGLSGGGEWGREAAWLLIGREGMFFVLRSQNWGGISPKP